MSDFFRFPSTPHLAWLSTCGRPRDDKILTPSEMQELLADEVVVEEKLDGANLGLSLGPDHEIHTQNRGQYLREPFVGQFSRLPSWIAQHEEAIKTVLRPELILFGEWCAARHSLDYSNLPDWYLLFDVYDRQHGKFWSVRRRNALAAEANLTTVPHILTGHTTLSALTQLIMDSPSRYRRGGSMEGVVVRRDLKDWCESRAKLVRADFAQAIDTHWRKNAIEWNRVEWVSLNNS